MNLKELRIEYQVNPVGLDVKKPRFSWIMESEEKDVLQATNIGRYLKYV